MIPRNWTKNSVGKTLVKVPVGETYILDPAGNTEDVIPNDPNNITWTIADDTTWYTIPIAGDGELLSIVLITLLNVVSSG